MRKTIFPAFIISLCLPFAFTSCHPHSAQNNSFDNAPIIDSTPLVPSVPAEPIEQTPSTPPSEPAEQTVEQPAFWDDSTIDISLLNPKKKLISFSFDDGPGKTLENILAVFADFNENNPDCVATATLFCNGRLINESSAQTLSMATLLGWELGNHTYSHCDLAQLPDNRLSDEIDTVEEQLKKIDKKTRHLFRAPYGRITEEAKSHAGVPVFNWTIDTLDWTGISAEEIYNEVMTKAYAGAIVLMHDGYLETVRALKRLLPDLKNAGYQVTGISQMAKAHGCKLKNGAEYIRCRPQK